MEDSYNNPYHGINSMNNMTEGTNMMVDMLANSKN